MNKKKKKPKSSSHLSSLNVSMRKAAFRYYNEEMEEITEKFKQKNQNADNTKFYLFQSLGSKSKVIDNIFKLAYFYDTNFTGNKDFMHIPNIKQITQNFGKNLHIHICRNSLAHEHVSPSCLDHPLSLTRVHDLVDTLCNLLDRRSDMVAEDDEVDEVNHQLTEDDRELVP